jgi:hypothetical protein
MKFIFSFLLLIQSYLVKTLKYNTNLGFPYSLEVGDPFEIRF